MEEGKKAVSSAGRTRKSCVATHLARVNLLAAEGVEFGSHFGGDCGNADLCVSTSSNVDGRYVVNGDFGMMARSQCVVGKFAARAKCQDFVRSSPPAAGQYSPQAAIALKTATQNDVLIGQVFILMPALLKWKCIFKVADMYVKCHNR